MQGIQLILNLKFKIFLVAILKLKKKIGEVNSLISIIYFIYPKFYFKIQSI